MTPKISYVIASRNDNFCGDPMERLYFTILNIREPQPEAEIVVVDWGSEKQIARSCKFMRLDAIPSRFVYVPPEITNRYPTPFNESLALNIGIRRAKGDWIGRLDQDILVGERFVKWFNFAFFADATLRVDLAEHKCPAFFSLRRDLPPGVHVPDDSAPIWHNERADTEGFYIGAVGVLLAPRTLWHKVRGYDERLIHRNAMEIDLCKRFEKEAGLVNLGALLDCPFYHQFHERADADARPSNDMAAVAGICSGAIESESNENWGLGDVELEEVTI